MWNFATHAGTGIAVAGLSATYYVLAKKNVELEQQLQISNDGGQPKMTASQTLLKKQFDYLSREGAHTLGLNAIEGPQQPFESVPSQYSGMDIKNIVSRAQINFATNPIFSRNISTKQNAVGDITDDSLVDPIPEAHSSDSNEPDSSQSVFDIEEYSNLDMTEDEIDTNDTIPSPSDETKAHKSKYYLSLKEAGDTFSISSKLCRCPASEESVMIKKKKSPILYYKNPGFGKRYACKIQDSTRELAETMPSGGLDSFNKQNIKVETDPSTCNHGQYRDSTQFIFPPVLSESKLSVCDDEQENLDGLDMFMNDGELGGSDQKGFDEPVDESLDQDGLKAKGLSQMDEIRDYNLQLQVLQEIRNTDEDGFLDDTPLPEVFETAPEIFNGLENLNFIDDLNEDINEVNGDSKKIEAADESASCLNEVLQGVAEKDDRFPLVFSSSSSSMMDRIPENSWISLPARLFAESETDPWRMFILLGTIVVIFGLLCKFLISLAGWVELYSDSDDYDPNLPNDMLEH